jgi:hypothetical protein
MYLSAWRLARIVSRSWREGVLMPDSPDTSAAERIARAFHESYERQAPEFGYRTREASAKPWEEVPVDNKALMIAVVTDLLSRAVIR